MNKWNDLANPLIRNLAIYEPGRPIEEVARELGFKDAGVISKLASNENPLGPSPKALKAMHACASGMHRYPDGSAYYLKTAIARKLGINTGTILPGNGSNELLVLLLQAFLKPGAGIVLADRAFVVYRLVTEMLGAKAVLVPMKEFTHDLDAMLKAIRADTRIVVICNPNNPTSTIVDSKALDRYFRKVPDHVVTCIDEAYIELLPKSKQPDTLKYVGQNRKVVLLRTFSKTYGLAGLRIGYAIAPEECISFLNRIRQPFNVNAMALAAAEAALKDDAYVRKTRKLVKDGVKFFEKELRLMDLQYVPAVVNFILVNVGNGREVFQKMMKEGVIVRPMDAYQLPGHVRITVGTMQENLKCIKALKKVLFS